MIRSRAARKRATDVLQLVGVTTPPVEVTEVAQFLGFTVVPFDFPDAVSAVTFIEGEMQAIGVNQAHPPTRQRFSIAHELGHFLNGHESYDHGKTHVEDRPTFLDPQNRLETEANEFAAELLMPETFLRRDLAEVGLDVPSLAKRYRVSEQAMWIQLMDLRLAAQYAIS